MRTQWTTKGNRDASSSCSCDRGLHRYLRNFGGGGFEHPLPNHPPRYATDRQQTTSMIFACVRGNAAAYCVIVESVRMSADARIALANISICSVTPLAVHSPPLHETRSYTAHRLDHLHWILRYSGVPRGGFWGVQTPPPEILKISVESSIT